MARQIINLGTNENDGTGDRLRDAMKKINDNIIELYERTGGDNISSESIIKIQGNVISCVGNLTITTYGTGNINLEDPVYITKNLRINSTDLDPNINLLVAGNLVVRGNTTLGNNPDEDRLILNSQITGTILPSVNGLFDLGANGLRFKDIYAAGTLYVGTLASDNVTITGGTIDNTYIGRITPVEGRFSPLYSRDDSFLGNLLIRNNTISAVNTNGNIILTPNGTGDVYVSTGLVITGNLTVNGTTTTVNSTEVTVNDLTLTLADGSANATAANGAGIIVDGAGASITYASGTDSWVTNKPIRTTNLNASGDITVGGKIIGDKAIVTYIIDGGGDAITTGSKKYLGPMNFDGEITAVTLLADQIGSIEIEIRKCSYADFDAGVTHPGAGDVISATSPLTLTSQAKTQDTTLTGWSRGFSTGDIFEFVVNSVDTITWVEVAFAITKG